MDNISDLFDEMLKAQALARGFEVVEKTDSNGGVAAYIRPVHKRPEDRHLSINAVDKKYLENSEMVKEKAIKGELPSEPVRFDANTAGKGKTPAWVHVVVEYKSMEGLSKSTPWYEKSVIEAIDSLYRAGNRIVREGQILDAMGIKNHTKTQREKLYRVISQMSLTRISIDDSDEIRVHCDKKGFDRKKHYRIACNIIERYKGNGGIANRAYEILEQPVQMQFAQLRGTYVTVPQDIWEGIPVSSAEGSIAIRDYLVERIKRHGSEPRILWDKLHEESKIPQTNTRSLKRRVENIMQYFVDVGYIKDFGCDGKGVNFTRTKGQKNGKKRSEKI